MTRRVGTQKYMSSFMDDTFIERCFTWKAGFVGNGEARIGFFHSVLGRSEASPDQPHDELSERFPEFRLPILLCTFSAIKLIHYFTCSVTLDRVFQTCRLLAMFTRPAPLSNMPNFLKLMFYALVLSFKAS